jgi:hypothetical protein
MTCSRDSKKAKLYVRDFGKNGASEQNETSCFKGNNKKMYAT